METEPTPATITIVRDSEKDIKMRDLFVVVDDRDEYRLQYGETVTVEVPAGPHTLLATNKVFRKEVDIDLGGGEATVYEVANVPTKGVLSMILVLTGTVMYKVTIAKRT